MQNAGAFVRRPTNESPELFDHSVTISAVTMPNMPVEVSA